ncbi:hypothetical protein QBC35DRAFT_383366 [Podospora australis]|uniref:Uncharacterized protein n=1 Tax=Podospora australis TaxID=1536484 RepID=A0AAN7AI59_9PEZI|nr:hypothetical protein QBC35DRAFT_383366 [Podospora australis]
MSLYSSRKNIELLLTPLRLDTLAESSLINVRTRIGHNHFQWFMRKLHKLQQNLEELTAILPIDDGKMKIAHHYTSRVVLLQQVANVNRDLQRFLAVDLTIAQAQAHRHNIMSKGGRVQAVNNAKPFIELPKAAESLRLLLQPTSWECCCYNVHPCGIAAIWNFESPEWRRRGVLKLLLYSSKKPVPLEIGFPESWPAHDTTTKHCEAKHQLGKLGEQARSQHEHGKRVNAAKQNNISLAGLSTFQVAISPAELDSESKWQPRNPAKLRKENSSRSHIHPPPRTDAGGSDVSNTTAGTTPPSTQQPLQITCRRKSSLNTGRSLQMSSELACR